MSTSEPFPYIPDRKSCPGCAHPRSTAGQPQWSLSSLTWLEHGSSLGCASCQVLLSIIRETIPDCTGEVIIRFHMSFMGDSLILKLFDHQLCLSLYTKTHDYQTNIRTILPDIPVGNKVPHNTGSDDSVDWIKRQLNDCCSSHPKCLPEASPKMPKRVLAISNDVVRLIDSQNLTEPYACLSYCWGEDPFLATTTSSLDRHRICIPHHSLPSTFQEAITVLRRLDIRYLWIDSLCIIQDDIEEWREQAAEMADIYENAYLVISALRAASALEGLFRELDISFNPRTVSVQLPGGHSAEIDVRRPLTHFESELPGIVPLPALHRGWIFQERLLASRIVHFGPQELMWECHSKAVCQCMELSENNHIDNLDFTMMYSNVIQPKYTLGVRNWSCYTERKLACIWRKLVEHYTTLSLTRQDDIFPAFAGISSRFQDACKSVNMSGLWRRTLLSDLLWNVNVESTNTTSTINFASLSTRFNWRAPSWSWASVSCPVKFFYTLDAFIQEECCTVEEAVCPLAGADTAGHSQRGHIILKGNLIPAVLHYHPDLASIPLLRHYKLDILEGTDYQIYADCDSSLPGEDHIPDGSQVYCFPLVRESQIQPQSIGCLLLKRVGFDNGADCGLYERIGCLLATPFPFAALDAWIEPSKRVTVVKII